VLRQCTFPSVDVLNSFFFQFTSILFLFSLHRREGVFTGGGEVSWFLFLFWLPACVSFTS